jgi:glycosyltransferase involved in cell wall biosynthesis
MKFNPAAAGKTTIGHCGVDQEKFAPVQSSDVTSFCEKYSISKPYILFIGDRMGYKNAWLLFSAISQMTDRAQFNIICIGGADEIEPPFAAMVPDVKVHVLRLDDKDLCAAYSGAVALAYPSIYEGFGLPILEAMSCDCPVITCQNSSLPEAAGAAALYVREDSPEEMIAAIRQVQEPAIREQLIRMGRRQVARFSWSQMAKTVRSALEQAASGINHG